MTYRLMPMDIMDESTTAFGKLEATFTRRFPWRGCPMPAEISLKVLATPSSRPRTASSSSRGGGGVDTSAAMVSPPRTQPEPDTVAQPHTRPYVAGDKVDAGAGGVLPSPQAVPPPRPPPGAPPPEAIQRGVRRASLQLASGGDGLQGESSAPR